MRPKLIILLIFLCFLASFVVADQSQLYTKISMTPFYNNPLTKNIPYFFNLSINPPDGVTQVFSAVVKFDIFVTSSLQDFNLTINNQSCNTPIFQATASGFATIQFDCSNIINQTGNYSLRLISTKDAGSAVGYLDLTYTNKKTPKMTIGGTEYQPYDEAKIFTQLIQGEQPINNATCFADVYYPNGTQLLYRAPMEYLTGSDGLYYYDLIAPNVTGVYMLSVMCRYNIYKINQPLTGYWSPNYLNGSVANLTAKDNVYMFFRDIYSPLNTWDMDVRYNFTNITISNASIEFDLFMWGWAQYPINMSIYNYNTSTWQILPNKLVNPSSADNFVSNTFDGYLPDYLNVDNSTIIRMTYDNPNMTRILQQIIVSNHDFEGDEFHDLKDADFGSNYSIKNTSLIPNIMFCAKGKRTGNYIHPVYVRLNDIITNITWVDAGKDVVAIECFNITSYLSNLTTGYNIFGLNCPLCGINASSWQIYGDTDGVQNGSNKAIPRGGVWNQYAKHDQLFWLNYSYLNTSEFRIDYLKFQTSTYNETPVWMIRGGGEMHITIPAGQAWWTSIITWLNATLLEMKSEISNTENMTIIINQTVTDINNTVTFINTTNNWIVQYLNVTEDNLHLEVESPDRCLLDTNWVLRAHLTDQYGITLSPNDNAYCNVTTDLWGTDNMTFDYVHGSFKYIHVCNPDYTTFNWTVECNQTG